MSRQPVPISTLVSVRWPALLLGSLLIVCAVWVSWHLLSRSSPGGAPGAAADVRQPAADLTSGVESALRQEPAQAPGSQVLLIAPGAADLDRSELVSGSVVLPDGRAAPGSVVTLYQQLSAWPEWRKRTLDIVTTGADGTFQFSIRRRPNLLIGFERDGYVGDLLEVPPKSPQVRLQFAAGIEVEGIVYAFGRPVGGAMVALESTVVDDRRVQTSMTAADGRFRFPSVAAGTMRVVARHPGYEPAILPAVVVGVDRRLELRFDRRSLSLGGTVVDAATQQPVANALVLALPPGQQIGRNQPAEARTGRNGAYRLTGLSRGNLTLEVRHPDYAVVERTLVVGPSPAPFNVDLPGRAPVRGVLRGEGPLPTALAGQMLTFRSAAGEVVQTEVAADGAFVFPGTVTPGWGALAIPSGQVVFEASKSNIRRLQVLEDGEGQEAELAILAPAVVTGRIVDDAGQPIAGAELSVTENELFTGRLLRAGSALLSADISMLGDQFTRARVDGPEALLAVSDDAGRYEIAGLAPGEVSVMVRNAGHGRRRIGLEVPALGETAELGDAVLSRGCTIYGRVQRGVDEPVDLAGAQVGVVVDGVQIRAITGLDGSYELRDLPPGRYRVRARYSTFPAVVAPETADVGPDQPARVDLTFPRGRGIDGRVSGSAGQPVEGVMVLVRGEPGSPVLTDANGTFRLEAPGRDVDLQFIYGDRTQTTRSVPREQAHVDIHIDTPPNCEITARVLGLPGRQLLPGVLVRIEARGADAERGAQSRWIDLTEGMLRYPWFPAGSWRVTFWSEGYAPEVRDIEVPVDAKFDFGDVLLEPGCVLRGVVVDDAGDPVEGARVFLGEEADYELCQPQLESGPDGSFELRGVTSATPVLVVRAPGYAWSSTRLRLPKDVLAEEPLRIRLVRGATILVDLGEVAGIERAIVLLRRDGRVVATSEVDENGIVTFANRDVGDYVVQRLGDDRVEEQVVVQESGEVVEVQLGDGEE